MAELQMVTVGEVYLKSDRNSGNMVVLKEKEDDHYHFIMFVGDSEFAAIAKEKGLVEPKRPLTHEFYLRIIENLPIEFGRLPLVLGPDGVFPQAVEVQPVLANHLRTRIFTVGIGRRNLLAPPRHERAFGRLPIRVGECTEV